MVCGVLRVRLPWASIAAPATARALRTTEAESFWCRGHAALRGLLLPGTVQRLRKQLAMAKASGEVSAKKHALRTTMQLEEPEDPVSIFDTCLYRTTSFLQYFNLWRESPVLSDFACSLATVTAPLLESQKLHLYGDTLFVKQQGNKGTSWHVDLNHVPLDTADFLTFWIPLQKVPGIDSLGSPLIFVDRSHLPRDAAADADLSTHAPLDLGDVTVHHGNTLHAAPGLHGCEQERWAWAVSFFAHGAKVKDLPVEDEEREAHKDWAASLQPGSLAEHELLPVVPVSSLNMTAGGAEAVRESDEIRLWLQFYHGTLLADRGQVQEAERRWRNLLDANAAENSSHLLILCLHRLGILLHDSGQLDHVEPYLQRAVSLAAQLPGMQESLAELLTDFGLWLRDSGDVFRAEQQFRRALICREEGLGPLHRDTLVSVYNLADVLEDLGQLAEAQELFEREVSWCRRFLGEQHHETRVSIRNLERFERKWRFGR